MSSKPSLVVSVRCHSPSLRSRCMHTHCCPNSFEGLASLGFSCIDTGAGARTPERDVGLMSDLDVVGLGAATTNIVSEQAVT